jgi:hypothetical protein
MLQDHIFELTREEEKLLESIFSGMAKLQFLNMLRIKK